MSLPPRIETAMSRLAQALGQMEAAVERAGGFAQQKANLEEQAAILQDDRARLAVELDAAQAHARRLEQANVEAERRLETIAANVTQMLELAQSQEFDLEDSESPARAEGR